MSALLHSLLTALRLLAGDRPAFRAQLQRKFRARHLRSAGSAPFLTSFMGMPFVCHPLWQDSVDLYLGKNPDEFELLVLARWLQHGDTFIDAGANMGIYASFAAAHVGPTGDVRLLEASRAIAALLRESWSLLGRDPRAVLHVALSDRVGTTSFFESDPSRYTGTQSLSSQVATDATHEVQVPTTTLNALASELPLTPAAIKVDIEGAEGLALAATPASWFERDGPLWIVEINPGALAHFGSDAPALLAHFPVTAFDLWVLPKHPVSAATGTAPRRWQSAEPWTDSYYYNLIAVPRGDRFASRRHRLRSLLAVD